MWFDARGPLSDAERKEKQLKRLLRRSRFWGNSAANCGHGYPFYSFVMAVGLPFFSDDTGLRDSSTFIFSLFLLMAVLAWSWYGFARRKAELYRVLHTRVQSQKDDDFDVSMDTSRFADGSPAWIKHCKKRSIVVLHGTSIAALGTSWAYFKFLAQ